MWDMFRGFLVLFLSCGASVHCGVLSGKALFCRDPDTGKLHAVNTTWTASTFCGNYTCNIKKRNIAEETSAPLREFNVTNVKDLNTSTENNPIITIERKTEPDIQTLLHNKIAPDPKNMIQKIAKSITENNDIPQKKYTEPREKGKLQVHKCKMHRAETHHIINNPNNNDRYLTEKEIDNIADMLHTIKKSDLDAIVDIYNLAQDIYKEIDEITDEEIKNEALNIIKEEEKHREKVNNPTSYWYDSLAYKGRLAEKAEMEMQNTYDVYSTMKPMVVQTVPNLLPGTVTNNGINERVPYYYPVTQFQRISSYTHPSIKVNTPKYDEPRYYSAYQMQRNAVETNVPNSRKLIQPSLYLPYPFANIHPYNYNTTDSRNVYYANPWMLDYYNNYFNKYYQPYYSAYVAPMPKAVLVNPQLSSEVQNEELAPVKRVIAKEKDAVVDGDLVDTLFNIQRTPKWKTDPIPLEVLKDIRADIDTSRLLKTFPFRKKVKLEKVGTVLNVNDSVDEANRNKRFVPQTSEPNSPDYEAVLERVTCHDQTEPGYFRIGNLSQPYPKCCPQLINTR